MKKRQKNRIHYEGKNQCTETNPELTQMLELLEKGIKIIITALQILNKTRGKIGHAEQEYGQV